MGEGTASKPMAASVRLEYASERKIREKNKPHYRLAHWPIWIVVFYLAPGPMTFHLFAYGLDPKMGLWLATVIVGTGIAALFGKLPGVEPRPYIIRFTEDRPNPIYRRICYTLAWSELISYAALNVAGLAYAITTGKWRLQQIYATWYFPIAGAIWLLGLIGQLPRVKSSTKGEGDERRYFYGTAWAVPIAQGSALILWKILPPHQWWADVTKLAVFLGVLAFVGSLAVRGVLPRTRKIVPGELAVSD